METQPCLVVSCAEQLWKSSGLLVRCSDTFVKKWPLEYQMVTQTYLKPNHLPTYLCDNSDNSDSSDSSDSMDSSGSSYTSESSDTSD